MSNLFVAYNADEEKLKCVFVCVVVKMESLRDKYSGGPKAFFEKYTARCTRDIAVVCAMSDWEIDDCARDLQQNGLVYLTDFDHVESLDMLCLGQMKPGEELPIELNSGVEWLKKSVEDGEMWVSFKSQ